MTTHVVQDPEGFLVTISYGTKLDDAINTVRLSLLLEALHRTEWNQCHASKILGITETRVRQWMRQYGMNPRNRRGRPKRKREVQPEPIPQELVHA